MAGFMAPGLGFASTFGAFIGGAAKQANDNMAAARVQQANDEKIWISKFADAQKQYEADAKDRQAENSVFELAKTELGGNIKAADQVVRAFQANKKVDINALIAQIKGNEGNSKLGPEPGYDSSQALSNDSLMRKFRSLQQIRQGMSPTAKKFFPLPDAPQPYGQGNSVPKMALGGLSDPSLISDDTTDYLGGETVPVSETTLDSTNLTGALPVEEEPFQVAQFNSQPGSYQGMGTPIPKQNLTERLKPGDFNTPEGYIRYDKKMKEDPRNPDLSDLRIVPNKLDPAMAQMAADALKHSNLMSPEAKLQFIQSYSQANKVGDPSLVRWDLAPTKQQIDEQDAIHAAGKKASEKYVSSLEKRGELNTSNRQLGFASNQMLDMISDPNTPLNASQLQPLTDQLNRFFNAAGFDLKGAGLLPNANTVEQVNFFKKLLGDMTFQQISQYHLGRWTNYEVGLLQAKLPSLDTDPNSIAKIALLFKSSSKRELETYAKETEIAFGANGENMFAPKDLGKAKLYGVKRATEDDGKEPWVVISDSKPTTEQKAAYTALPNGAWFENKDTGQMGRKGMFLLPATSTTRYGIHK